MSVFKRSTQERLARTLEGWHSLVRNTQTLSRDAAAAAVSTVYRSAGRPPPAMAFLSSPLACVCARRALTWRPDGGVEPGGRPMKETLGVRYNTGPLHERLKQIRACLGPGLAQQLARPLILLKEQMEDMQDSMDEMLRHEASLAWRDLQRRVWQQLRADAGALEPALQDRLLQGIERLELEDAAWVPELSNDYCWQACWGAWDCLRPALDDCAAVLGVPWDADASALVQAWIRQAQTCHWWLPLGEWALLSERPCLLSLDAHGRLHGESDAAVRYRDGCELYAWHGERVPARIIVDPGSITVAEIDDPHVDLEIRRIKLARYGQARYLRDSKPELIHQDARGLLWRKERPGDTPLVMVEVRNATPEPDGCVKTFLLRVPPHIERASDAVAWTFAVKASRYAPALET